MCFLGREMELLDMEDSSPRLLGYQDLRHSTFQESKNEMDFSILAPKG